MHSWGIFLIFNWPYGGQLTQGNGQGFKKQQTKTTTCKPCNFLHAVTDVTDNKWNENIHHSFQMLTSKFGHPRRKNNQNNFVAFLSYYLVLREILCRVGVAVDKKFWHHSGCWCILQSKPWDPLSFCLRPVLRHLWTGWLLSLCQWWVGEVAVLWRIDVHCSSVHCKYSVWYVEKTIKSWQKQLRINQRFVEKGYLSFPCKGQSKRVNPLNHYLMVYICHTEPELDGA